MLYVRLLTNAEYCQLVLSYLRYKTRLHFVEHLIPKLIDLAVILVLKSTKKNIRKKEKTQKVPHTPCLLHRRCRVSRIDSVFQELR